MKLSIKDLVCQIEEKDIQKATIGDHKVYLHEHEDRKIGESYRHK